MKKENPKICLICSSGGHLSQIKQIIPIIRGYNLFLLTEKNKTTLSLKQSYKTGFFLQQDRKNGSVKYFV